MFVLDYLQTKLKDSHIVVSLDLIFVSMYVHMGSSTSHYRELRAQNYRHCLCNISADSKRGLNIGSSKLDLVLINGKEIVFD